MSITNISISINGRHIVIWNWIEVSRIYQFLHWKLETWVNIFINILFHLAYCCTCMLTRYSDHLPSLTSTCMLSQVHIYIYLHIEYLKHTTNIGIYRKWLTLYNVFQQLSSIFGPIGAFQFSVATTWSHARWENLSICVITKFKIV